jgi:ribosomal protein S18 acetylase RimI-like enzyme
VGPEAVPVVIRRIGAGEGPLLRDVRLRALADAPLAFGSSHAREAAWPPALWEAWAGDAAAGRRQVLLLAEVSRPAAPQPSGLASGMLDDATAGLAHLFSVWVAPEARGAGAATALVEAVAAWAAERGAQRLRTSVTLGNDAAAGLYRRTGFADTGEREPLGHDDARTALLERSLRHDPARAPAADGR